MKWVITLLLCLTVVGPAQASSRHRYHHRHHAYHKHHRVRVAQFRADPSGIITVQTAAGIPIRVASHLASRFQDLIADLVENGYRPRDIGCFARSGHVRHSRHYVGAACDFDQTGWGKTASFMYTQLAHSIIVRHGFRDGREFGDQGHVDDGGSVSAYHSRHHDRRYGG